MENKLFKSKFQIPKEYRLFVTDEDARRIADSSTASVEEIDKAYSIINAYTSLINSEFISIHRSLEIQDSQSSFVERTMYGIGYSAAVIWFSNKTEDEILEAYNILNDEFLKALDAAPDSRVDKVILDIKSDPLYKLYGLFLVCDVHWNGEIYYSNIKGVKNIISNLNHIVRGVNAYIINSYTFKTDGIIEVEL